MIEALKSGYWSLRSKLSLASPRRLLQSGGPKRPAHYARLIRFGLFAIQAESFIKGLSTQHVRNRQMLYMVWTFPPDVNGGVYRPTALFKYGVSREWNTTVFAGPEPDSPPAAGNYLLAQIPPDVSIVRLRPVHVPPSSRRQPHPRLPHIDFGMGNVLEAYCEGRARFAADPPEMIVASGPPFHNFLAASLLARRFRSRLVLEYRDEWSENPFDWVDKHPDNRRWEAWCLAQADLVIFTTQSQLDHQLGRFSLLERRRCVVIPNGWDPEDFQHFDGQTIDRSNGTITIGFFGNFGAMGDPSLFLSDLAGVLTARPRLRAKFRFRIVGQKTKLALALLRDFPFPECLSTEDQLPKARACREMMAVDYLLLLNPPELARYIQGKLFEYVRSGTRILVYGAGGEAEEIVRTCNAGTIVRPGDVASLAELLEQASTSLKQSSAAEEWLARHKRDRLAAVMIDALNSVAGGAELSRT